MEKSRLKILPDLSGVYIFRDKDRKIIYIGKAKSIKKRVKSHFSSKARPDNLICKTERVDFIITSSETESLLLESYLIKKEKPYYNIVFRDDKTYPVVKVTLKEDFPRILITRKIERDGSLYIGPYPDAGELRAAVGTLRELFPFRSCKRINPKGCLYAGINLCPAPCLGKISKKEYRGNIFSAVKALLGEEDIISRLILDMDIFVKKQDFENAAIVRDKLKALSGISAVFEIKSKINILENIKLKLNLPKLPIVIDAVDISNISGSSATGAVVRFKDAEAVKELYRRYKIREQNIVDDYKMVSEVVERRFKSLLENKYELPDLMIIDGGKGHLNRVYKIMQDFFPAQIPLAAYAKGKDVLYSKYRNGAVSFASDSPEKMLLMKIRDEAHRFALSYHRNLRGRGIT
ncbi:MAG: GIY-YIG nuclease family protein, partial [Candidatus Omnitrophica bacterium]|nr:GIY-YIG nuclease family protein [Candidatus Omnitrophota bacterium]